MLAELYGIRSRDAIWSWHVTLDYDTDRVWRPGLHEAHSGILRFMPLLSLGQALALRDRLNGRGSMVGDPSRLRRELMQICRDLNIRAGMAPIRWAFQPYTTTYIASTSSRAPLNHRVLDRLIHILAGRFLLFEELMGLMKEVGLEEWSGDWARYVQAGACIGALELMSGMETGRSKHGWSRHGELRCRRCGSTGQQLRYVPCAECQGTCAYCEACLGMGKIRQCSLLIHGLVGRTPSVSSDQEPGGAVPELERWGLSPAQRNAASKGIEFLRSGLPLPRERVERQARFLIWAVTGAGKTEMIFPLVEHELRRGARVLITTPRKDVVLELKPRLVKAFPDCTVTALYGGSDDRWAEGEILLATTHQLLRFHRAFDLVIIDEIDALPYKIIHT